MMVFKEVVDKLISLEESVATMESCTGGYLVSEITNHPGASAILKFSAVTYSNEFKIKMGVNREIIDKYSVYSAQTAKEMALNIANFAKSTYGIGITGKINVADINNLYGDDDKIYFAIYDSKADKFYEFEINSLKDKGREDNKRYIVEYIGLRFLEVLNKG